MSDRTYDVCAAVVSDLPYDARVWKQARSLAQAGYDVALLGCRYDLPETRRRREDGIDVVEVPFGARSGTVSNLRRAKVLLGLWREILRTRARLYHAHNVHTGLPAWIASKLYGARLVYDGHELYGGVGQPGLIGGIGARLGAVVERLMVRHSDLTWTTNDSRAEHLRRRYGRPSIGVLQNVPPKADEIVPLDPGFPEGVDVLLYQGGIYASRRAFKETLEAVALLQGVHFAILGFGREHEIALIGLWADEIGVADRVVLLSPRPFDELVRTAAAATVGIVPLRNNNLNHFLGDTNKLHEYLMAGIPVVASDFPEVRRVVESGNPPVGELFDPDSPESIAAAVRTVLADRAVYEARRREARRLALERFNWEIEERHLVAAYQKAVGPKRAVGGGIA